MKEVFPEEDGFFPYVIHVRFPIPSIMNNSPYGPLSHPFLLFILSGSFPFQEEDPDLMNFPFFFHDKSSGRIT